MLKNNKVHSQESRPENRPENRPGKSTRAVDPGGRPDRRMINVSFLSMMQGTVHGLIISSKYCFDQCNVIHQCGSLFSHELQTGCDSFSLFCPPLRAFPQPVIPFPPKSSGFLALGSRLMLKPVKYGDSQEFQSSNTS